MYAGTLVEEAATGVLFGGPLHPYTRHLIGSLPRIGARIGDTSLGGRPPNLAAPPTGCRFHPRCPLAMPVCAEQTPRMRVVADGHRVACFAVAGGA
jgi:peptide/nickel transport system ATP-binding protein